MKKKKPLGNFFTLNAPKRKKIVQGEGDKMVTPTMFLKE
jgi:hypothetical protein